MTFRQALFLLVVSVVAFAAGFAGAFLRAVAVCQECAQ